MKNNDKKKSRKKRVYISLGVVLAIFALMGSVMVIQNQKPQITLGLQDNELREIPTKPNSVSTQSIQDDKRIEAIPFRGTMAESKAKMIKALKAYGNIEIIEEDDNYIYAIATTEKMKYKDDIEIYFDHNNQVIQYRSASRVGQSDMGLNRERYNQIKASYLE